MFLLIGVTRVHLSHSDICARSKIRDKMIIKVCSPWRILYFRWLTKILFFKLVFVFYSKFGFGREDSTDGRLEYEQMLLYWLIFDTFFFVQYNYDGLPQAAVDQPMYKVFVRLLVINFNENNSWSMIDIKSGKSINSTFLSFVSAYCRNAFGFN